MTETGNGFTPPRQTPPGPSGSGGVLGKVVEWIAIALMLCKWLVVEPPKYLMGKAYGEDHGFVVGLFGLLSAIGLGIGLEHWLVDLKEWSPYSGYSLAALLTAFWSCNAWPALYYYIVRWFGIWSGKAWDHVPTYDSSYRRGSWRHPACGNEHNWLTQTLCWMTGLAAVIGGAYYVWANWADISGAAVFFGGIFGLFVLGELLKKLDVFFVAAVIGAALTHWASAFTGAIVGETWLGALGGHFGYPLAGAYLVLALQFGIFVGFVFPWLHRFISLAEPLVKAIAKRLEKLWDDVYSDDKTAFRDVFLQLLNIYATVRVGMWTWHLMPAFEFSPHVDLSIIIGATFLAALAGYMLIGQALKAGGNILASIAVSAVAAAYTVKYWLILDAWFGIGGAMTAAAVVFALAFALVNPIVYKGLRWALNGVSAYVRDPLVNFHKELCHKVSNSFSNTYEKKSDDSAMVYFHVVNIVFALSWVYWTAFAGVFALANQYAMHLASGNGTITPILEGFASVTLSDWALLAWSLVPVAVSYIFIGKALLTARNYLLGLALAIAFGVGIFKLLSGTQYDNTALTVAGVGGAFFWGAFYPIGFTLLHAVLEKCGAGKALGALKWAHDKSWNACVNLWNRIVDRLEKAIKAMWNLVEDVYATDRSAFRDVFLHVLNIFSTVAVGGVLAVVLHAAGFTSVFGIVLMVLITLLAMLAVFTLFGYFLLSAGNVVVGLACSVAAYFAVPALVHNFGFGFGPLNDTLAGVISAAVTFLIAFPLFYRGVRKIGKGPAEKVRDGLVNFHREVCKKVGTSFWDTYMKPDDRSRLWLHIVNFFVVADILFWGYQLAALTGLAKPWVIALSALALVPAWLSYVLIGKAMQNVGNLIAALVLGAIFGFYTGAYVHGQVGVNLGASAGISIAAGLVMVFIVYPLSYAVIAVVIEKSNAVRLLPTLQKWHGIAYARYLRIWAVLKLVYAKVDAVMRRAAKAVAAKMAEFGAFCAKKYAEIDAWIRPILAEARRKFNEAWERAAQRFNRK
jgi:hypothetical protein